MKNINFAVNSNGRTVQGILTITKNDTAFLLSEEIGGKTKLDLYSQDINDVGNFIASVVRRLDTEAEFESITLVDEEKTFIIKRANATQTTRLYKAIINDEEIVTDQSEISTTDIYGNEHALYIEDFGFNAVDVPVDFLYTKDPVLNLIYQNAVLPHDYNRKMNTAILKEIGKRKKANGDKPWAFWCTQQARIMEKGWNGKLYDAVYVDSDMIRNIEDIVKAKQDCENISQ